MDRVGCYDLVVCDYVVVGGGVDCEAHCVVFDELVDVVERVVVVDLVVGDDDVVWLVWYRGVGLVVWVFVECGECYVFEHR